MRIRLNISSFLAAAAFSSLSAQTNTGSIGGTVEDVSGAAMSSVRPIPSNTVRLIRHGGLQ